MNENLFNKRNNDRINQINNKINHIVPGNRPFLHELTKNNVI